MVRACAWFLFAAAVDAAPGYLAQRLAEHGLAMAEFARTGRGVQTERDRAAGERVFYWFDKEVVFAERALERRADVAAAAAASAAAGAPLAGYARPPDDAARFYGGAARAGSSLGDAVRGARVVFFFTSLSIFVGSTAPPPGLKSSSAAPCSQSAEPDLSQLCRRRCHSSKSKYLTRLRALYSLFKLSPARTGLSRSGA